MRRQFPFLVEALTILGLIAAPFVLPHLGFSPATINRILVWGLVGIGFDLLFGYTGLLSFGQSAFFGSGGMFAAYLLTQTSMQSTIGALLIGTVAAGVIGFVIGLIALRRTGIYFAMITVAIAEVFFFVEFNPLSDFTGGENGLPGVPTPTVNLGFTTIDFSSNMSMYAFLAFWYFVGLVIALRLVRSPFGLVLRAIRENPLRAQALGHCGGCHVCGFRGWLAGVDARLHAARRLHVCHFGRDRHADGHRRCRHLVRPPVGRGSMALPE